MTRQNLRSLGVLGALLVTVSVVVGLFAPDHGKADAASHTRDLVTEALTVTTVNVNCADVVVAHGGSTVADGGQTLIRFKDRIGALQGTPPRLWNDALDTPYVATDPQKMLEETQAKICENPLYGVTIANWFANMSVGDVHVVDLNTNWLTPFKGDAGQINDQAASYMLLDVANPTDQQKQTAVTQNIAWQNVAERLGTLLNRFKVVGVQALPSTLNYHLAGGGVSAGQLPEVGLNPAQENLPALILALYFKGQCIPQKIIGLNTGDKRPEEFALPVCETPAPTTTAAPPGTTPPPPPEVCKHNCTPSTTPPPTTICTTGKCVPPTTTPPPPTTTTPPTTVPPTTTTPPTTICTSGKCSPPTTTPPPPTTAAPSSTTAPPSNGGRGDSGDGATNTTSPPTTQAPAPAPPTTDSPTSNPSQPPAG